MNTLFLLRFFTVIPVKSYVAIVLATMAVVVVLPMLVIFSMGTGMLSFLNGSISSEQAERKGFYMGGGVPGNTYAWGNCTYWVFAMRLWADDPIPASWGNANTWDDRARADGYEVSGVPRVGSIMQTDAGEFGHVAYVIAADGDTGSWTVSEMNAPIFNVVSQRTFSAHDRAGYTFIYGMIAQP